MVVKNIRSSTAHDLNFQIQERLFYDVAFLTKLFFGKLVFQNVQVGTLFFGLDPAIPPLLQMRDFPGRQDIKYFPK